MTHARSNIYNALGVGLSRAVRAYPRYSLYLVSLLDFNVFQKEIVARSGCIA